MVAAFGYIRQDYKMRRKCFPAVMLMIFIGCQSPGNSQSQNFAGPVISDKGRAEINLLFQEAVTRKSIPGAVAIVAGKDRILYHQSFGKQDVSNNTAMPKDAIFRIASMTKPVTSVAIMMLVEEGKLKLDDPIAGYVPALSNLQVMTSFNEATAAYSTQPAGQAVTIRHLLSHTTGWASKFSSHTLNCLKQKTGKSPPENLLLHEPGSKWTYGSRNTNILADLIKQLSGKSFETFLKTRIFDPLEMKDTFYDVPKEKYNRVVTVHQRSKDGLIEEKNPSKLKPAVAGSGGLFSTAEDYAAFLQMLLNDGGRGQSKLLSQTSIALMTTNQIGGLTVEEQHGSNPNPFPMGAGMDKFGLGFQITASPQTNPYLRSPGSYSWGGGYNTHFWVDPQKGIAVVLLMQVAPYYDDSCMEVCRQFEELIYRNLKSR